MSGIFRATRSIDMLSAERMHQLIIVAIVALISAQLIELLTFLFDAVTGLLGGLIGFALLAFGNWKASRMINNATPAYYVWRSLPFIVIILLPFLASFFIDVSFDFAFWILMLRLFLGVLIPLVVLLYLDYQIAR
jgi:hypothetical protein